MSTELPTVSVILPARDERSFIRDCLDSLLRQDYPAIEEILVLDGGSRDGTRQMVVDAGPPVRLIDNPGVTAAAAMNRGIGAASGEIIVRADAHAVYAPDYVARCVDGLDRLGAAVIGGPMRPVGTTTFGRAVAAVTCCPLGIGPGRFHYATEVVEVETVYLGAFRRSTVLDAGGYDEHGLQWAAEDQELNFRIRARGGKIWVDPAIKSWYFPRQTPHQLWRQYFNYGMCKASTLRKHGKLPYWRPLLPAAMVGLSGAAMTVGAHRRRGLLFTAPAAAYGACATVVAMRLGRDPAVAPHRAFMALAICHWSYGLGFWSGLGRIVSGRRFDVLPKARR